MEKFFEERKNLVVDFLKSYLIIKELEEVSEDEDICDELEHAQELTPKNAFNPFLATGQIRLLSQTDEITYVVLLRRWEDDSYVVVPFSHFATPATDEELKTHYDGGMFMQVLQIWNIRTLRDSSLRQSWLIFNLNNQDCQDAWRLWEHTLGGKELSDDILKRTALPIYKSQDPRLQYKQEALANFAKLDAMDSASSEYNYTTTLWGDHTSAMAAGDEEYNPRCKFKIANMDIVVRLSYSNQKERLSLRVYDLQGEKSLLLENWQLIDKEGNFLGIIAEGRLLIEYPKSGVGEFSLLNSAGESIALAEV